MLLNVLSGMSLMNSTERPSTSLSLLNLAKSGDAKAWTRLTELYGPVVFVMCKQKGLQDSDAHDVTQEIFVSICKSLPHFKKTAANHGFLRWVNAIARNRIADFYRQKEKLPRAIGGSVGLNLLQASAEQESENEAGEIDQLRQQLAARVLAILKKDFQPNTWQAFYLTMVSGRTTQETADELGMTAAGVRVARMRVRKRLKEEFGDLL